MYMYDQIPHWESLSKEVGRPTSLVKIVYIEDLKKKVNVFIENYNIFTVKHDSIFRFSIFYVFC